MPLELAAYLKEQGARVDARLATILPHLPNASAKLYDAMSYSLLAGGKRLRPIFFLTVLRSFGMEAEDWLDFACGLEMIHTFSLIHDDLPAMDNDDYRRGKPSCHKAFDEATAILAGDGLLIHAFAVMAACDGNAPAERKLAAFRQVALATGLEGMLVGQMADVTAEEQPKNIDDLAWIDRYKTGALFISALTSAALLAGATTEELQALTSYGRYFGVAFQIVDDILDVTGDAVQVGKPIGSDEKNGKVTYVSLLGLPAARQAADQATAKAIAALSPLKEKGNLLASMAQFLLTRRY